MNQGNSISPPKAFISYARADGEAFAKRLSTRLGKEEPEITLWRDREEMVGGVGWWRQITEALERVEFLILVMTPGAIASEVTRREWRYARQQGVCVFPVQVPDSRIDFRKVPTWMARAHFFDLEKEWDSFIRHLKSPCRAARVPFMAPGLPNGYIERRAELNRLCKLVLNSTVETPVAITTALHGAGGFGKTTLASALCHADRIITEFDDGVLWVTLGQTPDLVDSFGKLYSALTGDRPAFRDVEDAAQTVWERLGDKRCLLVLDDAWDPAHVAPFMAGCPRCTRLVTTRRFDIAITGMPVPVDTMTPDEATALLMHGVRGASACEDQFRALSHRLGEWALLLSLVSVAIRKRQLRGEDLRAALTWANATLDREGVVAFDFRNASERQHAVRLTIKMTLDDLDRAERKACASLSIFAEDIDIPVSVLPYVWHVSARQADKLAERLADVSLVQYDLARNAIRMHDMIRKYLAEQLSDTAAEHGRLIETWGDLKKLPDDYAWRWVAFHLHYANRDEQLTVLLSSFVFLSRKLKATDVGALIRDFDWLTPLGDLAAVRDALRLSTHALATRPTELASQLLGRLSPREGGPVESTLVDARRVQAKPWLRPLSASLVAPGGPLVKTLSGHTESVMRVVCTKNGSEAVSCSADKTVKVWDLSTGSAIRTLVGHTDMMWALDATPDGRRAVTGSRNGEVIAWDLQAGTSLRKMAGHAAIVDDVAITPDGAFVLSGARDGSLIRWNVATGRALRLSDEFGYVERLIVLPDGERALSLFTSNLLLWSVRTGRLLRRLPVMDEATAMALVPGAEQLVVGSNRGRLQLISIEDGRVIRRFRVPRWTPAAFGDGIVAVTPNARSVVFAVDHSPISVLSLKSGRPVATLKTPYYTEDLATLPDRNHIIIAHWDRVLRVWDLGSTRQAVARARHAKRVIAISICDSGERAVSASDDGTLRVWHVPTGECQRVIHGHKKEIGNVQMTADGTTAVSISFRDRTLRVWNVATGQARAVLKAPTNVFAPLRLTSTDEHAIFCSPDGRIHIFDIRRGRLTRTLKGHADQVRGIALTPDNRLLISVSRDTRPTVWDLQSGRMLRRFAQNGVDEVEVLSDGRRVVMGGWNQMISVWDIASGELIHALTGHTLHIDRIAVSPDGERVIVSTGEGDHLIRLWDIKRGRLLESFEGPIHDDAPVATMLDNEHVVFPSRDEALVIWNVRRAEAVATFTGDSAWSAIAVTPECIVAGEENGAVHVLRIEGLRHRTRQRRQESTTRKQSQSAAR